MVYESGRAAAEIGFWLFDRKMASSVDASKVTCPVLIVAGSEDRITPVSVIRKVQNKYKTVSTYKEFPNHAHWVIGEPGWENIAEDVPLLHRIAIDEGIISLDEDLLFPKFYIATGLEGWLEETVNNWIALRPNWMK